MVGFWILSPIMVIAALWMIVAPKAVHAALLLATVMIALAVLYIGLDAPFLFVVQIIVYTGAILMLFLFVLMLVGVDSSDSLKETISGHRIAALVVGLVFLLLLVLAIAQTSVGPNAGLVSANHPGNVQGIAYLLFNRYVFAFEATSALLITGAVGAMVLAHRERLTPRKSQADLARERIQAFAETGHHPGPLPPPGVFARSNAVDTPALLPDGTTAPGSVSRVMAARGVIRTSPETADDVVAMVEEDQ